MSLPMWWCSIFAYFGKWSSLVLLSAAQVDGKSQTVVAQNSCRKSIRKKEKTTDGYWTKELTANVARIEFAGSPLTQNSDKRYSDTLYLCASQTCRISVSPSYDVPEFHWDVKILNIWPQSRIISLFKLQKICVGEYALAEIIQPF